MKAANLFQILIYFNVNQENHQSFEKSNNHFSKFINEECISNKHNYGKCKQVDDCSKIDECEEGKFCSKKISGKGKCQEYVEKKNDTNAETPDKKCVPGLFCAKEISSFKGKCGKYGTLEIGKYCNDDEQKFKTGIQFSGYCNELTSVCGCDASTDKFEVKDKEVNGNKAEITENLDCNEYEDKKNIAQSLWKSKNIFKIRLHLDIKN